jgi:hypothetical protein
MCSKRAGSNTRLQAATTLTVQQQRNRVEQDHFDRATTTQLSGTGPLQPCNNNAIEWNRATLTVQQQRNRVEQDHFDRATATQLSGTGRDVRLELWDLRVLDLVESTCFASKELKAWKAVEELDHDRLAEAVLIRRSVRHSKPTLGGVVCRQCASECVK